MFGLSKKQAEDFFSLAEKQRILDAIQLAERNTSGEVRVFIESKCRFVNAMDRAAEIFFMLEMDRTEHHNATLVYVAMKDRQFAIFGDEGIYKKTGQQFWSTELRKLSDEFYQYHYAEGIAEVVKDIGEALSLHFPYEAATDKNELPDEIVFGK